jgi:hypothetical protein
MVFFLLLLVFLVLFQYRLCSFKPVEKFEEYGKNGLFSSMLSNAITNCTENNEFYDAVDHQVYVDSNVEDKSANEVQYLRSKTIYKSRS